MAGYQGSYPSIVPQEDELNNLNLVPTYPALTLPATQQPIIPSLSPAPMQYISSPSDPLGSLGLTLDDILRMQAPQTNYPPVVPQMSDQDLMAFDKQVNKAKTKQSSQPVESEVPATTPSPSLEDEEMKRAIADKRANQTMLMMAQGAHTAGMSIAGVNPDKEYTKPFQELAGAPVEDIKTLRKSLEEKLNLDEQKTMSDPNSQASQMQRKAMKDMLSKIGYKSLSDKISDNMSARQVQGLLGNINIQNLMQQYESMQNRLEVQRMKQEQLKEAAAGKLDDKDTKRLDQANKLITASLQRNNTAFGRGANIIRSAEAIENLVEGMDFKDIDKRQIYEIASSLDAMLTSGASTVSGREHLIPKSFSKDLASIKEYITNRPKGAGQEQFVKRMLETVHREKELAKQQLKRESKKMLSTYSDIKKRNPEIWGLMLKQHDLDPSLFEDVEETKPAPNQPVTSQTYDSRTESGIKSFMTAHPELNREQAIKILKDAGKIK